MTAVTDTDLLRCYLVMEVCRSTGLREFPMQLASTFFWIASHNGCLQNDLMVRTSMSSSSVSRNVDWLGALTRYGKEGLKLVRRERDTIDRKRFRLFLTPKGEQFSRLIAQQLTKSL